MPSLLALALMAALLLGLPGCGYRTLQRQDEDVRTAWSEVANEYQRRAELIPTLARAVRDSVTQEQQGLVAAIEARAREAGSIPPTPELLSRPQVFAKFQSAQSQLGQAIKDLLAVTESYPQLSSDANFKDLQSQIGVTESRLAVARDRYVAAVRGFNSKVRSFPTSLTAKMFDFQAKPNITVSAEPAAPPVAIDRQ